IMTGAEIENSATFMKRLELKADEGKLTVPAGTVFVDGSVNVYPEDDDCGVPLEVTVSGTQITLPDGSDEGNFIVYGIVNVDSKVKKMSIKSTTFPKAVVMYGETINKGEDDTVYPYKLIVYKASPQPNFTFRFANNGDPVTLTLNFDMLVDENNNMMDLILLEEE
ncbi:MAG: hypothetical protein GX957_10535, partial [Clostridiaceae bacterium]|nr:hypothetical protein [Clostridiaceae bacterium]